MDFRYFEFDAEAASREELLQRLRRLFHELLLRAGGDVEEAMRWLDALAKRYGLWRHGLDAKALREWLERQGEIQRAGGRHRLSARGEQVLRRESLDEVFSSLARDAAGEHRVPAAGEGFERLPETRPWVFGDAVDRIDAGATLRNALSRGLEALEVREADLEVHETEHHSSCATVLLIDVSHSMVLYGEDRITPAKRVAMALVELIRTRYPKDSLQVATFGDEAREVALDSLPYLSAGPFHTNTRAALVLARDMLRRKKQANRQVLMVTDGKPSCLTERNGKLYKNPFGLDRRVVDKTLDEAVACRREGIPVTTFMLTHDPLLVGFVEEFTAANRGRAYYSRPGELGAFLLVDYLRNRRRRVR